MKNIKHHNFAEKSDKSSIVNIQMVVSSCNKPKSMKTNKENAKTIPKTKEN